MDYKDTLLLPQTDFEMRGNLNKKEPSIQARWDEIGLYEAMLAKREGQESYVLHDGPPYANGNIHIGHALNSILKDFIVRSHFAAGYKTPFRPGWDTHGLPIETAIQKQGIDRKSMSVSEFRRLCEDYARKQVEIQMRDFKVLGKIGDYKNPYLTLDKHYEAMQIRVFAQMALKGLIYKGLKPVYWSPSSETALAEAEIEYYDRKDPAIYVAFDVVNGKNILSPGDKFIIWTTTPWTIPANLAISVNPDLEYCLVDTDHGRFVLLESLKDQVITELGYEEYAVLKRFKGQELELIEYKHPLYDRISPILLGDHVTADAGTGSVHTAPDHGVEDFDVAKRYGIEPIGPVDEQGHLNEKTGEFAGLYFEKANGAVLTRLEEVGALLKMDIITHSYAHDWRTKKPIIYRATTQWFASIEPIRETILDEIAKVNWHPHWGEKRMHNMIADRADWTISRQRVWGVPLPIFYAEDGTPIMDAGVFEHVANLFEEHGSNVWFEREAKDLLPENFSHPHSPGGKFSKEKDIMDVWFDSGSSHTAALDHSKIPFPVDAYAEGSDQYRGWFNSSLIIAVALYGVAPYKNIISHGFIRLDSGEKMSKSKSNGLSPNEVTSSLGADILRLWVASVDYQSDVTLSQELLKQVSEAYRKIRNTFKFMHGNLKDFDEKVSVQTMSLLNRYVVNELNKLNKQAQSAYASYDFQKVSTLLLNLLTNTLSAYYLDYTKDILYLEKKDSQIRREVQTVIRYALDMCLRLLAPILVHTTEELYLLDNPQEKSIHLESFVPVMDACISAAEAASMERLFDLREKVNKALEEKRAAKEIGKSLEAEVNLLLPETEYQDVKNILADSAAQWLIVSKVNVESGKDIQVSVKKAEGTVCPRCWNIVKHSHEDGLCDRCYQVVKGL